MNPLALLAWVAILAAAVPASTPGRTARNPRAARPAPVLSFRHDYTRAVAEARARRVPIFVEAWAPW